MANPDSRCLPLVEVELDQIQALLSPVLKGAAIAGVERVEGGLTNTLYRITPADGGVALCLRIFAAGRLSWEKERELSVGEREFIEKNCARLPKAHDYSTTEIAIVLEVSSRLTIPGTPTHR
jgi:hypothetical protein